MRNVHMSDIYQLTLHYLAVTSKEQNIISFKWVCSHNGNRPHSYHVKRNTKANRLRSVFVRIEWPTIPSHSYIYCNIMKQNTYTTDLLFAMNACIITLSHTHTLVVYTHFGYGSGIILQAVMAAEQSWRRIGSHSIRHRRTSFRRNWIVVEIGRSQF